MAFAFILNVNATSATTVSGINSVNSSVKSAISSNMTNQANTISAISSKPNTYKKNLITEKAVSIKVDKTKPKVIKSDPANRTVNVSPNKKIKITFSEAIKFGSKWIILSNSKGKHYTLKTISINGNVLTLVPYSSMINGLEYYIAIHSDSIKDLSSNPVHYYVTGFKIAPVKTTVSAALQQYLKPTANCQSNNPTIKALAESITKGSTSQYTSAAKIFNWVRDHISYSFYYNTQKGALGTLKSRSANCADTTHLMVALERAAGITARYNHGSCRFSSGNVYGHVWAQVYVNGKWYYADGTSSRNSFGVVKNWNTKSFTLKGIYASLPF